MIGPLLVTGGSGFVGHHLVAELRRRGIPARVLVRPTSRREGLEGVELATGDLSSGAGLRAAVAGTDAVLHLAGLVTALRSRDFFEVNAGGTRRLVEACLAARPRPRRLVLVSSLSASGPARGGQPRVEEDPPRPVSFYGRSKLAGEEVVRAAAGAMEVVVLRPPAVYGPRDAANATFLQSLEAGWAVRFRGALRRLSLVEVGDLVEAILLAARAPGAVGRTYFVCHPEILRLEEMLGIMADALGVRPRSVTLPGGLVRLAGGVSQAAGTLAGRAPMLTLFKVPELLAGDWSCSPARIERELGFRARTSAAEGVPRFVRWFVEESGMSRRVAPRLRIRPRHVAGL